jgi:1,4-dihydroxy-2-naphthoyl-CoA hydrolase
MVTDAEKQALLERFRAARNGGLGSALNFELGAVSETEVQMSVRIGPQHLQPFGIVHGGVFCSLVETVCSIGASFHAEPGSVMVGVENQTSFLKPVREGSLSATARPIHLGRSSQLWEATIHDERKRLVACGRLRLFSVPATQDA